MHWGGGVKVAHIVLSVEEALEFQRAQQPLPPEVESISSSGDTLIVKIDPKDKLPKLLQRFNPKLNVNLAFETFEAGRASFRVNTALNALPVTSLAQLLLKIVSVPELEGIELQVDGDRILAWVDLQMLISKGVEGVTVTNFKLIDNSFVIDAAIHNLEIKQSTSKIQT